MKRSKFSDSQIIDEVKRVESCIGVPDICHELGAFGDALQMAGQARRHVRIQDVLYERAGRRKPALDEDVP